MRTDFLPGKAVVRILDFGGMRIATLGWTVARVGISSRPGTKGRRVVRVVDRDGKPSLCRYSAETGRELDPVMPDVGTSEIVLLEGE